MGAEPGVIVQVVEGELSSVELHPGSVLVLMSEDELSGPLRNVLRAEVDKRWPGHGAKLLILDNGKRLAIVNRSEERNAEKATDVPAVQQAEAEG